MSAPEDELPGTADSTARSAGIMTIGTALSRITGFLRIAALAAVFGRNFVTDAYQVANTMPNMIYELVAGGVLSSLFIPTFVEYLSKDDEDTAWHIASTILNIFMAILVIVTLLGIVYSRPLVAIQVSGFKPQYFELANRMFKVFVPQLIFYGIAAIATGILNSYRHFTSNALAPVANNVIVIIATFTLGLRYGIMGLAVGTTLGVVGMALFQVPALIRYGFRWRPVLDLRHPAIRKLGRMSVPILLYVTANQVALTVQNNIASYFRGGIMSLSVAWPLQQLFYGIFAVSVTMALFPEMSESHSKGDIEAFRALISRGIRFIGFILIPASVGLMALAYPTIGIVYQRGKFVLADTLASAPVLIAFAVGIFAFATQMMFTRAFYSMQDTLTPMKAAFLYVPVNIVGNYVFSRWLGVAGVALGYSLSHFFSAVLLGIWLRNRTGGWHGRRVAASLLKMCAASAVMAAAILALQWRLGIAMDAASAVGRLTILATCIPVGAAVYALCARLFSIDEMDSVFGVLRRRLPFKSSG